MASDPVKPARRSVRYVGMVLLCIAAGAGFFLWKRSTPESKDADFIAALVASEETLLGLTPVMGSLSKGLQNIQLPDSAAAGSIAAGAKIKDLAPAPPAPRDGEDWLEAKPWPVASEFRSLSPRTVIWQELLQRVSWFESAKLYIIKGTHPGGDESIYDSDAGFEALAMMKTGEWRSFSGKMHLLWSRSGEADTAGHKAWQISSWETQAMESMASRSRFFVESLNEVVPAATAWALRRSEHYAASVKYYQEGMKNPPHPYFSTISANHKPGVTVADLNGDGFDDIYITVRIGTNKFLLNNGDGTFTEAAERFGLALPGHTTSSLFADFDNDGDLDAILGRSLLKTAYLENTGSIYVQHKAPPWSPMAVVSMSAADYNKDGLLDVYLCTYRAAAPPSATPSGGVSQVAEGNFDWMDEFLPPDQAQEYRRRLKADAAQSDDGIPNLLNQTGPPNMLLINRGQGIFEPAPENNIVGLWRNSLQATWADYDGDGDPDLYVANDWAPDNMLRNDGAAGFVDVTAEAGTVAYGFAMGASWGDYDNDGKEDIYVSNMYSKAGRRITAQIPGLSKTYAESAEGNWLYHQEKGEKFTLVSGLKPPAMTVTKAGWSWGGKFADFDNDGWLDIYALSGYFTAPKELSSELDL